MTVPYTFASRTSSIPLSELDQNFATVTTLGNATFQMGNTVTTVGNLTLTNVTISSGDVSLGNVTYTGTLTGGTGVVNIGSGQIYKSVSGDVGIGTSSPGVRVDASGQVRALEAGTGSGNGGLIGSTASADGNAGVLFQTNSVSRWNLTTSGTAGANLRIYNYALASTVATFDSSGNLLVGTTSTGADGLGISNVLNLTFPEGSGTSYTNLFRQASSAATVIANGYKRSATASGFASSIGTSWAKTAIGLGVGTGAITFYTDSATTVANGTDATPTERMRIDSSGNLITNVNAAAPSLSTNSTMSFELTSNTSLKIVVRGTDGVTRSATLTLS